MANSLIGNGPQSPLAAMMSQVMGVSGGDVRAAMRQEMRDNPQFAEFVNGFAGASEDELASQLMQRTGIDGRALFKQMGGRL